MSEYIPLNLDNYQEELEMGPTILEKKYIIEDEAKYTVTKILDDTNNLLHYQINESPLYRKNHTIRIQLSHIIFDYTNDFENFMGLMQDHFNVGTYNAVDLDVVKRFFNIILTNVEGILGHSERKGGKRIKKSKKSKKSKRRLTRQRHH
jgi:hypothetical protein